MRTDSFNPPYYLVRQVLLLAPFYNYNCNFFGFSIWSWLLHSTSMFLLNNWTCRSMITWNKSIHIVISSWLRGTKLPKPQWTLRTEKYQAILRTFKSAEIQRSLAISKILQAITGQGKNWAWLYQQICSFSLFSLRS